MSTTIVLPGDAIPIASSSKSLIVGPGIHASSSSHGSTYTAGKIGVLSSSKGKDKESIWIESRSRRVRPPPLSIYQN